MDQRTDDFLGHLSGYGLISYYPETEMLWFAHPSQLHICLDSNMNISNKYGPDHFLSLCPELNPK